MVPVRQTLTLPHMKLSYLEWRPSDGVERPPLLLLHGLGDHALVWSDLAERWADRFHVIAPDMHGHGESSKLDRGYTFPEVIGDLEALLDHLGWAKAHILGHSWAGKLAPIWARMHPGRFASMILVDPIFIVKMPAVMKVIFPILYRVLDSMKGMGPFATYEEAEALARTLRQYQGWSPLQEQVFRQGMEQKPDGRWGSKFVVAARNQIFEDVMKVPGLTVPLTMPTLFVRPEQGVNRMTWQMKPYHQFLKNLTVAMVPGNHWPYLVEHAAFYQAVDAFLMKQVKQA
ncbi:alpha/beta fold hydrolase [Heliophilum fasciatum]|uniref:Pimeloyl-ACP methyl ester carboxylesterase n=1 Tax=Heliophilum fasciatum TaxID=35700 RepID=A0A4R2RJ05_9FIRM|nr:alpha/beta hydrolase [Heliophilum fasciatum]MCW2278337.1 pimeloyl-ACP methyl ester carboxylesterase [Heliophilum fasciatum]TCP63790.1 pimeloyl-ACP methyl ester carboxylesterase [Heliophilum fasciatum]